MTAIRTAAVLAAATLALATSASAQQTQLPYQGKPNGDFTHVINTGLGPVYLSGSNIDVQRQSDLAQQALKACNKTVFDQMISALRGEVSGYDQTYNSQSAKSAGYQKDGLEKPAATAEQAAQDALQDANSVASILNWLLKQQDWAACDKKAAADTAAYKAALQKSNDAWMAYQKANTINFRGGALGGGVLINTNDPNSAPGGATTGGSPAKVNHPTPEPSPSPAPGKTATAPTPTLTKAMVIEQPVAKTPAPTLARTPTLKAPTLPAPAPTPPTAIPVSSGSPTGLAPKPLPTLPAATTVKAPVVLEPPRSATPATTTLACPAGQKAVTFGGRTSCAAGALVMGY